ncbi:MAG: type II secretion protein F [Cellulomonas sp.]
MSGVVGLLVLLAVLVGSGGPGRRMEGAAGRPGSPGRARRVHPPPADLSAVLLRTSAQLRAGASPADAWAHALGCPTSGSVPSVGSLLAATAGAGPPARRTSTRHDGDGPRQRARAVVVAARLSGDLGAPLAGVLDRIASAVAADEEAEGERRAALAGPRATARVLAWLPLLGLALGGLLGADPVGVVLSGGVGTVAAALGGGLLLLGRWWTATLLRRAARP